MNRQPVSFIQFQVVHHPMGDGLTVAVYGLDFQGQLWVRQSTPDRVHPWEELEMPEQRVVP
jgi:hypothetical protein